MNYEIYQCIECGHTARYGRYQAMDRRCPECGAPMLAGTDLDEEDENDR